MVRFPRRPVCGLAFFLCATASVAGSYTGATVSASTTVSANCTIATVAVNFGSYDPVGTNKTNPLQASGQVAITCVQGTAPTVTLGLGVNASGSTRRLKHSASANYLNYELYQPPNNTPGSACSYAAPLVWGTSGVNIFSPTSPASKAARTYRICGNVPASQDPAVGTYADTVTATVNF